MTSQVTCHRLRCLLFAFPALIDYINNEELSKRATFRWQTYVMRRTMQRFSAHLGGGTSLTNLGSAYTVPLLLVLQAETSKLVSPCAVVNILKKALESPFCYETRVKRNIHQPRARPNPSLLNQLVNATFNPSSRLYSICSPRRKSCFRPMVGKMFWFCRSRTGTCYKYANICSRVFSNKIPQPIKQDNQCADSEPSLKCFPTE